MFKHTWVSVDVRLLTVLLLLVPRIPDPCANLEKTESAFLGGESLKCDNAKREPCVSSCQIGMKGIFVS
jgi:hypothetical protein